MSKYLLRYLDYKSLDKKLEPKEHSVLFDNAIQAYNFADKNFPSTKYVIEVKEIMELKEEILAFLKWAENTQASSLCYNDGYSVEYYLSPAETIELVDDYIKLQEEIL